MSHTKDLIKVSIFSSVISLLVLSGIYFAVAQTGTWSDPTAAPPGDNALAPLNAGPTGQSKSGGLILNTGGAPNGLIVNSGATSLGGQLSMNNNKITNLQTATADPDAVNFGQLKSYVAAQSGGGISSALGKIIFITSTRYSGNLGGLAGADQKCKQVADASPITSGKKWKALLSTSTENAFQRLSHDWIKLVNTRNEIVADFMIRPTTLTYPSYYSPWIILRDTSNQYLISEIHDEAGRDVFPYYPTGPISWGASTVWTGTTPSGSAHTHTCNDWTGGNSAGMVGASDTLGSTWMQYNSWSNMCDGRVLFSIYCVEQ